MGRRGLITVARDLIKPLLVGEWSVKQDESGTTRNEVGVIAVPTRGPNDSVITASNYETQIAANRGPVHSALSLTTKSVGAATLRIFKPKILGQKSLLFQTRVRAVPEPRRTKMLEKAAPGSVLSLAEDFEEIVGGHRLVDLLTTVNANDDIYQLQSTTAAYLGLIGNSHWYTPLDSMGIPTAIIIAPSEFMRTQVDGNGIITGYIYKHGRNEKHFEKEEIVHFKLPAAGEQFIYYGRGDLMGAIDDFNLLQRMYLFEKAIFDNGGIPATFVSVPNQWNEEQRQAFRQQYDQRYGGAGKAGRTMVGEGGAEAKPLSLTPREMDYRGSRKFTNELIYNNMGAPVTMLSNQVNSRMALDAARLQIGIFQVEPMLTLIQQALNAQLVPKYQGPLFVKYDDVILPDKEFDLQEDTELLAAGAISPNEVRTKRGMQPIEGGDTPYIDFSRVPLGTERDDDTQARVEDMVDMAFAEVKSRMRGNG
jgi:HK97 family phage portal protein